MSAGIHSLIAISDICWVISRVEAVEIGIYHFKSYLRTSGILCDFVKTCKSAAVNSAGVNIRSQRTYRYLGIIVIYLLHLFFIECDRKNLIPGIIFIDERLESGNNSRIIHFKLGIMHDILTLEFFEKLTERRGENIRLFFLAVQLTAEISSVICASGVHFIFRRQSVFARPLKWHGLQFIKRERHRIFKVRVQKIPQ